MGEKAKGFFLWLCDHVAGTIISAIVLSALAMFMTSMSDVMNMGAAYPVPFWKLVVAAVAIGAAAGYGSSVLLGIRDARARREESERKERESRRKAKVENAEKLCSLSPDECKILVKAMRSASMSVSVREDDPVAALLWREGILSRLRTYFTGHSMVEYVVKKSWVAFLIGNKDAIEDLCDDSRNMKRAKMLDEARKG